MAHFSYGVDQKNKSILLYISSSLSFGVLESRVAKVSLFARGVEKVEIGLGEFLFVLEAVSQVRVGEEGTAKLNQRKTGRKKSDR